MNKIKVIALVVVALICVVGSGFEESSKLRTDDMTSAAATMALHGITQ